MTSKPTGFGVQRRPFSRRAASISGWRCALLAALTAGAVGSSPAVAADDRPALSATIHSSGGGVQTEVATLGALAANSCPLYSGATPALHSPQGAELSPALSATQTWSIATVLQCGLVPGVAPGAVTRLTVTALHGPELGTLSQLTPVDLTGAGDFADSAQPLITYDGSNILYYRPWRGGADHNAGDEVIQPGQAPIAVDVYEGPPLAVTAQASSTTVTAGATIHFSAAVNDAAGGTPPPASTLSYAWDFDGGATSPTSSAAAPDETFPNAGTYSVTLSVTDTAGGGGADTTLITVNPAGNAQTTPPAANAPPTGPANSNGINPGGIAGKRTPSPGGATKAPAAELSHGTKSTAGSRPARTIHAANPVTPVPASTRPTTVPAAAKSGPRAGTPVKGPAKAPAGAGAQGKLIDGRVISDVAPLALDASPLVSVVVASPATAPQVRRPAGASILRAAAAALAVVVLLLLGAAHQLRWLRDPRARVVVG